MSLAGDILRLRWRGNSARVVAAILKLDLKTVRRISRDVSVGKVPHVVERTPLGPVAKELVERLWRLDEDQCGYIELHVDDVNASPCGRPCCTVHVKHWERRSAWCAEHHVVVYPEVLPGYRRIIV